MSSSSVPPPVSFCTRCGFFTLSAMGLICRFSLHNPQEINIQIVVKTSSPICNCFWVAWIHGEPHPLVQLNRKKVIIQHSLKLQSFISPLKTSYMEHSRHTDPKYRTESQPFVIAMLFFSYMITYLSLSIHIYLAHHLITYVSHLTSDTIFIQKCYHR